MKVGDRFMLPVTSSLPPLPEPALAAIKGCPPTESSRHEGHVVFVERITEKAEGGAYVLLQCECFDLWGVPLNKDAWNQLRPGRRGN